MRVFLGFLLSLLLTSCITLSPRALWDNSQEAVFPLETLNGSCTTFHIGDGYFVTAAHCVNGIKDILFIRNGSQPVMPTVLVDNDKKDIAILFAKELKDLDYLSLGDEGNITLWDQVTSIGFPGTSPYKMLEVGYLVSVQQLDNTTVLLANGNAIPGMSGGPLLDPRGFVIGVVSRVAPITHTFPNGRHMHRDMSIFISVMEIREELNSVKSSSFFTLNDKNSSFKRYTFKASSDKRSFGRYLNSRWRRNSKF